MNIDEEHIHWWALNGERTKCRNVHRCVCACESLHTPVQLHTCMSLKIAVEIEEQYYRHCNQWVEERGGTWAWCD